MDKKTEYFVKKIERAINDGNYTEAKIYYDKAILYLGQIPEVISYKSTIDSEIKRTKPNKQDSEDVSGIRKRKPINEALIILPIMALVIIGYLIYFFTNTYPMHHITKELSGTWYQGDLSSSSSKGVYLEFKDSIDNKYEIWYRTSSGHLVAKLECEIVNGKEIIVDGYPIKVEFDGDYVTFSPSFVDTSEESVWRNYREYTSSDKTGNFSKDDTLNSSDLSHTDSSTNSNSTTSDNNSGETSASSGSLPSGETGNDSSANTSTGDHTNVSDNVNDTTCAKGHTWKEATCTEPATCTVCGITTGSAKGHTWKEATCTEPATCTVCGITTGSAKGHTWKEATCTEPATCTVCGITTGSAKGHTWKEATCTEPATCTVCGITSGSAKGHTWKEATCTEPAICAVCGITSGSANGHDWVAITQAVHHDATGHYETVTDAKKVNKYKCPLCNKKYDSIEEYYLHFDSVHENDFLSEVWRERYETVEAWEYYDTQQWVVDSEAYDETVITGYRCSICGQTK